MAVAWRKGIPGSPKTESQDESCNSYYAPSPILEFTCTDWLTSTPTQSKILTMPLITFYVARFTVFHRINHFHCSGKWRSYPLMNSYSTFVTLLITPPYIIILDTPMGIRMAMVCTGRFGFSGGGYMKLRYRKDSAGRRSLNQLWNAEPVYCLRSYHVHENNRRLMRTISACRRRTGLRRRRKVRNSCTPDVSH